jgi:hypothetical protein
MLASSMTLFSISEDAPAASVGGRSRSSSGSDSSLNGWGTSMTRKTYKMDLSSLASSCAMESKTQESSPMECEDVWGNFVHQG